MKLRGSIAILICVLFGLSGCSTTSDTWDGWFGDGEEERMERMAEDEMDGFEEEFEEFNDDFEEEFEEEGIYEDGDVYVEEEYLEEEEPAFSEEDEDYDDYGDTPPTVSLSRKLRRAVVYFDYKSAVVSAYGLILLELQANYLIQNPQLVAEVSGFTDSIASQIYNRELSLRRAQSVAQILVQMGVPLAQIEISAFGESDPAVSGSSPQSDALNRRVEVLLR